MRRVVAVELVSLDGVMEAPEEWAFSYSNDEMEEANASGMAASDALLLGRATYEGLAAFWPNQPAGTPMVDYINSVPKFIVSGTLEEPLGWNNSTLIKGDVAREVDELKRRSGKDITIIGSGTLVRSLLWDGLLDELNLMVHPIVLGGGKRLFDGWGDRMPLQLVDAKTFATGVLHLTYRPTIRGGKRRWETEDGISSARAVSLSEYKVTAAIAVSDMGRAREFYEGKLGLSPATDHEPDDNRAYRCGEGSVIHVYLSPEHAGKATATLAGWYVDDVEAIVDELTSKGVIFERYDEGPVITDEKGVATFDGGAMVAYFKDPDGNTLSVARAPRSLPSSSDDR